MQVIIPMAGFGKRLRPHTYSRPKPLINVAGKSVLGHVLDSFAGLEISELLCITGYLGEQIETYVKTNYQIPARFYVQEELNGQSPAIYLCKEDVAGPASPIALVGSEPAEQPVGETSEEGQTPEQEPEAKVDAAPGG